MKGILAIIGLVGSLSAAEAQHTEGRICAGPLLALRNPLGYGGQAEYRFSERLSMGVIGRYWQRDTQFPGGDAQWSGYTAQATLAYHHFNSETVDPYLLVCAGWSESSDRFGAGVAESERTPAAYKGLALSAALGLRYFFLPHLALNWAVELFATDEKNFAGKLGANVGLEVGW